MGTKPADLAWLQPGVVLLDKYTVEAILGHGAMGIVVRAFHPQLHKHVAIKFLRAEAAESENVLRFQREAQATARLKSDHVARVDDVGRTPDGASYMVMELLDGADLGHVLAARGKLPVGEAVDLVLQACEALAEAHALGIVHRDIKPTNLFVLQRGGRPHVKVLDFGISKILRDEAMNLTQTQSMLGTPSYMSPEQMRSARMVDTRTDIWAVGTVLYELIEGVRPFEADSFSEIIVRVSTEAPRSPVAMPPELARIVMCCLAKSPDARYTSIADLAAALYPFAGDPTTVRPLVERMARYATRATPPGGVGLISPVPGTLTTGIDAAPDTEPMAVPRTSTKDGVLPFAASGRSTPARGVRALPAPSIPAPVPTRSDEPTVAYRRSPWPIRIAIGCGLALIAVVAMIVTHERPDNATTKGATTPAVAPSGASTNGATSADPLATQHDATPTNAAPKTAAPTSPTGTDPLSTRGATSTGTPSTGAHPTTTTDNDPLATRGAPATSRDAAPPVAKREPDQPDVAKSNGNHTPAKPTATQNPAHPPAAPLHDPTHVNNTDPCHDGKRLTASGRCV